MAEPAESPALSWLARTAGIDRSVAYTVAGRVGTMLAGLVSVGFVAAALTPAEQGFHYTFASILSAQVFFELGLTYVILQYASHEFAGLAWVDGTLQGDPAAKGRLASVLRLALRWYGVVAALMLVVLVPGGLWFFARSPEPDVFWQVPWVWLVGASAGAVFISPVLSLLEGCGLVAQVAAVRSLQSIAGQVALWITLASGGRLFAAAMASTTALVLGTAWLLGSKARAIRDLAATGDPAHALQWRADIWPFQWRIAVSWLSGYFIFYFFNPLIFSLRGPAEAGRFGMTLTITGALAAVGMSWVSTRIPTYAGLIATGRREELDRVFQRNALQAIVVVTSGAVALCIGVALATAWGHPFASRILAPGPFALMAAAAVVNVTVSAEATYLRAHKRDPFLVISLLSAIGITVATVLLGRRYGTTGVAVGYLSVLSLVMLGGGHVIFLRKKRSWQQPTPQSLS